MDVDVEYSEIADAAARASAKPGAHFSLHFIEDPAVIGGGVEPNMIPSARVGQPVKVSVKVAGVKVGELALYEVEWVAFWRAMVHALPSFDRQGIALHRTGPFR